MKNTAVAGGLAAVMMTLAGCATHVQTLPLPAAGGESRGGVQVYFGEQDHPAVQRDLGEVSYSVRIARETSSPEEACHKALHDAVKKLNEAARDRHANAVIDVSTRFHSTQTRSSTDYTCGVSPSAAAIAVRGHLVVLESN